MVVFSRVVVPILGLVVWMLLYLHARFACEMPAGARRLGAQLLVFGGAVATALSQVRLMDRLAPEDAHGIYFHCFIFIEAGGGLVVLFSTLLLGSARQKRLRERETAKLVDQFTSDLKRDDLPN